MGPQIVPVWQHREASCRYGNTGMHRDGMATQPHGPHGAPWAPSPPVVVRRNFEKVTKNCIFQFLLSKMDPKWGPRGPMGPKSARSCAAPSRKSHQNLHFPIFGVQNGSKMGSQGSPWGPFGSPGPFVNPTYWALCELCWGHCGHTPHCRMARSAVHMC